MLPDEFELVSVKQVALPFIPRQVRATWQEQRCLSVKGVRAGERSFVVEMVVDRRPNGGEFLQTPHAPETLHGLRLYRAKKGFSMPRKSKNRSHRLTDPDTHASGASKAIIIPHIKRRETIGEGIFKPQVATPSIAVLKKEQGTTKIEKVKE